MCGPVLGLWVWAAADTITVARKALDVLTRARVIAPSSLSEIVRRSSTVFGSQWLVDFDESMIT
jgi:hypothetical protein